MKTKKVRYELWELACFDNGGPLEPFVRNAVSENYMVIQEKFNKLNYKMPCAIFIKTDDE